MKTLLVLPPGGFLTESEHMMPPLGLAYLAAILEQNEKKVEILDAHVEGLSWKDLHKKLVGSNPDIIGVTFTTETRFDGFKTIKIAKTALPNSTIIAGGPHVSLTAEDTLRHIPELDIIVRGEGENTLLNLINALESKGDFKSVQGISYRENGKIKNNPPEPFIENLDTIPFPARHLLPMDKYNFNVDVPGKGNLPFTSIMTSRGCPFGCCFCATSEVWGRRFRGRSPQNVIDEIEFVINKYKVKGIWFFDDTFTLNKKRTREICDLIIKKGLDISWFCDVRVDGMDKNLLKKMKDAGCYSIAYGVESGSQRILDEVIGKKIELNQVKNVAKWSREVGIHPRGLFILSLPTETYAEAKITIEFMRELGGENSINILKIYPGNEVENIARGSGILPEDFSWATKHDQNIPSLPSVIGNAPIFIDKLTWEEIGDLLFEFAELQEYSIYKRIPGAIKNIKSYNDLTMLMSLLKAYLKRKIRADN
ncbi:MAG: cobalamin-dependent protein [Thermoplasmata archaeon]|nr:MAG: cobalamin-dependent protein [Thermoplasmata archaeon]